MVIAEWDDFVKDTEPDSIHDFKSYASFEKTIQSATSLVTAIILIIVIAWIYQGAEYVCAYFYKWLDWACSGYTNNSTKNTATIRVVEKIKLTELQAAIDNFTPANFTFCIQTDRFYWVERFYIEWLWILDKVIVVVGVWLMGKEKTTK